jgi:hypothetical protein
VVPSSSPSSQDVVGIDICACSPTTYEFTFDFSLFCLPVNIPNSDAVQETFCQVTPFEDGPSVTDLVPVSVIGITVLELDQNINVLVREYINGNFSDGDTFQYTSIAANPDAIDRAVDVPEHITFNFFGVNDNGESIVNFYAIKFTNNCDAYPVLEEGQSAGWTRFVSRPIRFHRDAICR